MSALNSVNERLTEATQDQKYVGLMIGIVIENNDPKGIGRIKVKLLEVLDDEQGPVPWCLPTRKSPFGQGQGYGVYGSPMIGSLVRVTFQDGDSHYPVYESDEYTVTTANPKFKNPDTWGFKDPGGSELFVNYTTGAWEFTHQSGTTLKYDGQGNVQMHVVKDLTETIDGNQQSTVNGTLNFTVVGNATIQMQGDLNATVSGTANVTATGPMNLKGNPINLN